MLTTRLLAGTKTAAGVPPTYSFFGAVSSTTNTVTLPSSLLNGDIGVCIQTGLGQTNAEPTGWTLINTTSGTFDSTFSWKVLSASDSSSSVSGSNSPNVSYIGFHVQIFRPVPLVSVLISDAAANTQQSTIPPTLTAACTTYPAPNIVVAYSAAFGTANEPFINEGYWTQAAFTTSPSSAHLKSYYIIDSVNTSRSITQSADYGSFNMTGIVCINGN